MAAPGIPTQRVFNTSRMIERVIFQTRLGYNTRGYNTRGYNTRGYNTRGYNTEKIKFQRKYFATVNYTSIILILCVRENDNLC